MIRSAPGLVALFSLCLAAASAQAQFTTTYESVAVTEFMVRPNGNPHGRQWVELHNFGDKPVELENFHLNDEANKTCDFPKITIQPHDFVICVLGHDHYDYADREERKKIFEAEWLGGKEDARVFALKSSYTLAGADTLILQNRRRTPIWIMGWQGDDKPGFSTYLAIDDFRIRHYGNKQKPSINRTGNDGTVAGYEGEHFKQEDLAWKSDVSKLEAIGGPSFKSAENGGNNHPAIGSPLKGNYPGAKNN
jgi:hypothetical protein